MESLTKTLKIGITGINAIDNPAPGTGVARSLQEDSQLPTKLFGLAYNAMEPGLYMNWLFDHCFIMPYPSEDPTALIERLRHIQEQVGLDCIIPNFDVELPLYIHCQEELNKLGIRTYLPTKAQFALRNKTKLVELAPQFGIKTPETLVINSLSSLENAINQLEFPLMIKGSYYKAYRVTTREQAIQRFYQLAAEWGYPILVQEVVEGTELNLVGVGDGLGGHLGLVAIKKMTVTEMGKIWSGVTVHHEGLQEAAEAFLQHTCWRGAFELECMVDRNGVIYLIEINPRFPAWTYFATGVGINLPSRLVRAALGLPIPAHNEYTAGKMLMRYTYEIITDVAPLQALVTFGEV